MKSQGTSNNVVIAVQHAVCRLIERIAQREDDGFMLHVEVNTNKWVALRGSVVRGGGFCHAQSTRTWAEIEQAGFDLLEADLDGIEHQLRKDDKGDKQ
jgi:hypothetical protein